MYIFGDYHAVGEVKMRYRDDAGAESKSESDQCTHTCMRVGEVWNPSGQSQIPDDAERGTRQSREPVHCTVHPPPSLSLSRRFPEPPGMRPTICGSSRSVSAPDTADTAEKDVIRDSRSDLSPEMRLRRWPDDTLSAAVTALRMLAEFGDVLLLLDTDRGRSDASLRRRTERFRATCRGGCDVDAADDWLS